jgi:hypothetical protein
MNLPNSRPYVGLSNRLENWKKVKKNKTYNLIKKDLKNDKIIKVI